MCEFKNALEAHIDNMIIENERLFGSITDTVSLLDYECVNDIWTSALQTALNEHEAVIIPFSQSPYIIDAPIVIPSGRKIIADRGAVIRLASGTRTLMLRNEKTADGTHLPLFNHKRDECISIEGGIWEDWCEHRMGYGQSGRYDEQRSIFGVSTLMLLECVNHLRLKNMVFRHCGGFAVQIGEASCVECEGIRFEECFADGLHINGNVDDIYISDIRGEVGDDLVAFNMFDWQNSSINFGPCKNVICEDLELSKNSYYKALRIETGLYTFDSGEVIDCSLTNAVFRRISGIKTFKLYCQTPVYYPDKGPEKAGVGSGDCILFEDIKIDLDAPIDLLDEYTSSHPIKGSFAGFELGTNIERLYFKNIDITLHRDRYPLSYLICAGPKSVRFSDGGEVFDPYLSSTVKNIFLEGITVNGVVPEDISTYIKEIAFDSLYDDIPSTASGKIENIYYKK